MVNMTIQDWGAIGEILGAMGVILTLLYLAGQLRQNTKALRSGTYQSYSNAAQSIAEQMAEAAELIERADNDEDLTPAERMKVDMVGVKIFSQHETIFLHYRDGLVDEEVFEAKMSGLKPALKLPRMRVAWDTYSVYDMTPSFVEYVEESLDDIDT